MPAPLSFHIDRPDEKTAFVRLAGEFTGMNALHLKEKIFQGIAQSAGGSFIIDMSGVSYIDSTAIELLFECHKRAKEKRLKFALMKPNENVRRVLGAAAIPRLIDIL